MNMVISDIRQYSSLGESKIIRPKTVLEAVIDSETNEPISTTLTSMKSSIEDLKNSVSEGKSAIASTLTSNGVSTAQDAPFDTINTNVGTLATKKYNEGYAEGAKAGGVGVADLPTHPALIEIGPGVRTATIFLTYSNTEFLKGVLTVYKTGSYPTSLTDGDSVDTEGKPTSIIIDNLEPDTEYYFRVFLYNEINGIKYYQTDVVNSVITCINLPTIPINTKNIEDVVKIKENGVWVNFVIVHKGLPSNMYDESCDGIWLVRQRAHSERVFSDNNINDYENSYANAWLNGEYYDSIGSPIRTVIKSVKIPFKKGSGNDSAEVQSGADGLSCKVFLLSGYEIGLTQSTSSTASHLPIDGAKLSYFIDGDDTSAKGKRIAKKSDGTAVYQWLRSAYIPNLNQVFMTQPTGTLSYNGANSTGRHLVPAFVLPSNLLVNSNNEVVVPDYFEEPTEDWEPEPGTLEETDWETISKIAERGTASSYWSIGDTKTIQLSTGEEITVRIEDFDHDDLTTGGKAPITFGMMDCLKDTQQMNGSNTNNGGWDSSNMRTSRMPTLFDQLPADLQKVIKSVTKTTSAGNNSSSLTTTDDLLWLFSYTEVNFDHNTSYSPGGEGTAYPLFISASSRIKKRNGSAHSWWLRSPYATYTAGFCYVNYGGGSNSSNASASFGVAVGFCI